MREAAARRTPIGRPSGLLHFFKGHRLAVIGMFVIAGIVLVALTIPLIVPFEQVIRVNPLEGLEPPSRAHIFGTDRLGRDVLQMTLWATRVSLAVGVLGTFGAVVVGTVLGLFSGYKGGWWDRIIVFVVDSAMAFPLLLLALTMVAMLGNRTSIVIVSVAIAWTPRYVRLMRASVLSIRGREYVDAARAVGASDARIVFRHIMINAMDPIFVLTTLGIGVSIVIEASLSYLGLGTPPPTPSWGQMIASGQRYLSEAPWLALFPSLALLVTVLAFNIVGDGLRDALDPRISATTRAVPEK